MDKAGNFKDAIGQRFGRALVLSPADSDRHGNACWTCRCECGKTFTAKGYKLRRGTVASCGCLGIDVRGLGAKTHGMSSTRLFRIWTGMKSRCSNPKTIGWPLYGGRGISVCEEWLHSFENFRDWSMLHGYAAALTIDRQNTDGNYEPNNCRWATMKEQANNTRRGRLPDGRRIIDLAAASGLKMSAVRMRISKGWPLELACTTPKTNRWHSPHR